MLAGCRRNTPHVPYPGTPGIPFVILHMLRGLSSVLAAFGALPMSIQRCQNVQWKRKRRIFHILQKQIAVVLSVICINRNHSLTPCCGARRDSNLRNTLCFNNVNFCGSNHSIISRSTCSRAALAAFSATISMDFTKSSGFTEGAGGWCGGGNGHSPTHTQEEFQQHEVLPIIL